TTEPTCAAAAPCRRLAAEVQRRPASGPAESAKKRATCPQPACGTAVPATGTAATLQHSATPATESDSESDGNLGAPYSRSEAGGAWPVSTNEGPASRSPTDGGKCDS